MIDIKSLAEELDLSRQDLNYHICRGHAGDVKKDGVTKTSSLTLTIENVIELVDYLITYGRGRDIGKLVDIKDKYVKLNK